MAFTYHYTSADSLTTQLDVAFGSPYDAPDFYGWQLQVHPDLFYYVRAAYMETRGLHIEPVRYLLQQDTRRWQVSVGMQQRRGSTMTCSSWPVPGF
ncbi:hypothetical protein [uncultured Mitsuokella sp.]|uniref:hypothetical protein n=1 Tax=uncultured Mitsuokella sp. TaxID=453120 RepID=UPI00266FC047|nr:hypothetical protein [uncultured Mitsuokella sp.]